MSCDHKFVDSKHCLKCGWEPPADHSEQLKKIAATRPEVGSLGEALPREMARVRDELIPMYQSIGPAGSFGIIFMRKALDEAAKALAEQDVVAMIRVYQELKDFKS